MSVDHNHGWTDQDAVRDLDSVEPKEPYGMLDRGPDPAWGRGNLGRLSPRPL